MNANISNLTNKQVLFREAKDYVMIALGMILYGIGWTIFLLPNDITTGGVPGIASIVFFATKLPVQYTYFAINAFLLLLALKILGFKFCVKTIYAVFVLTFFLSALQGLVGEVHILQDQPFMACVLGASFCGSGIGIAFSANGSSGGTDIIAAIINKYRDVSLGRVVMPSGKTCRECFFLCHRSTDLIYSWLLHLLRFSISVVAAWSIGWNWAGGLCGVVPVCPVPRNRRTYQ